jgi:tetratricopeptide (TPR) repeat protein
MGLTLIGLGRDEEAIEYLEKAKPLDPYQEREPQAALAGIYARLRRREQAAAELQEFIRLRPDAQLADAVLHSLPQLLDQLARKR